jgi:putative transposase
VCLSHVKELVKAHWAERSFYIDPNIRLALRDQMITLLLIAAGLKEFVRRQHCEIDRCDFFCKSIWSPLGKRNGYVLVFLHLGTRKVWTSPTTYHPDEAWVKQQARNFMMWLEDHGLQASYCLRDRDTKFTRGFDSLLASAGIKAIKTPVMAPNANAFVESWIASIKRECLSHFVCFSRSHLDHIVDAYVRFYNEHRPHQGLGNRTLSFDREEEQPVDRSRHASIGRIAHQSQLGGLLKHYYRQAA